MKLRVQFSLLFFLLIGSGSVESQEVPVTNPPQSSENSSVTTPVTEAATVTPLVTTTVQTVATAASVSNLSSTSVQAVSPAVPENTGVTELATTNSTSTTVQAITTLSIPAVVPTNTTVLSNSSLSTESSSVTNTSESSINSTAVEIAENINVTTEAITNTNDNQSALTNEENLKQSTTSQSLLVSEGEVEVPVTVSTELVEVTTRGNNVNAFNVTIAGDDQSVNNIVTVNTFTEVNTATEVNESTEVNKSSELNTSTEVNSSTEVNLSTEVNFTTDVNPSVEEVISEASPEHQPEESVIDFVDTTTNTVIETSTSDIEAVTEIVANESEMNITDIQREVKTESRTEFVESRSFKSQETSSLDLQTQLYIISGTFGAVVFLLILLVLTLALSVAKIKDQLCDSEARYIPGKEQIHGYQNGAFNGGTDVVRGVNERSVDRDSHSDLKDLGYTIYNGKGNRENVYKVNDPMSTAGEPGENIPLDSVSNSGRRQMMKYEEGVIPMADEEHGHNYR